MFLYDKIIMSSSTTKLNGRINNALDENYLFSPSVQQFKKNKNIPSEPNIKNNTLKSDIIKKKTKNSTVSKNSLRNNQYSNLTRKKTNEFFQNFLRKSTSRSRQDIETEGNSNKNISKIINNNFPKNQSTKKYYNAMNTFKNTGKQKKNRNSNSNSMKRNINLNLNNLYNLQEYKYLFSNATKRKKNPSSNNMNQKLQAPLQTNYHKIQKNSNSYDNKKNIFNKTQTKYYFSHNQINTLGNLFTTANSTYTNTDCNVGNRNNIRNEINRKYYNSKIYKDINSINSQGFQLPVRPSVSPNNANHIQNYFSNLHKKQNNKEKKENNKNKNKECQNKINNNINIKRKNEFEENHEELNDNANYVNKNNFDKNENGNNIINMEGNLKEKIIDDVKNKYDGPEEIHYYYVQMIQNGKLMEKILGNNNFY